MHANTRRLRALIGARPAAIKLTVAFDALSGLHQALAAGAGAFDGLRHKCPCCPIFPSFSDASNGMCQGMWLTCRERKVLPAKLIPECYTYSRRIEPWRRSGSRP